MDLSNLLSKFSSSEVTMVYVSVTPGLGLEMIDLDVSSHTIKRYGHKELDYNESLRQIADVQAFKTALSKLLEEFNLNPKNCRIVLNLPMVYFGNRELPLLLSDDAVMEALTAVVEQSYIFKRYEPTISWSDSSLQQAGDTRKLFYSAIQKNKIDEIIAAVNDIGAKLVSVQMSLTSLLKALEYLDLAKEQMQDNVTWNLMIIKSSGYSICSMVGKNIADYYEEPLAIKSFEGEEIYNAIVSSAEINLMSYPANYLFIVSETDIVSAELLAGRIGTSGATSFWEDNDFKKQTALPTDLEILQEDAKLISLETIGIASGIKLPMKFDFLSSSEDIDNPDEPVHVVLGSKEFDITPNKAKYLAMCIAGVLLIPSLFLFLFLPFVAKNKQAKLDKVSANLEAVESKVKDLEIDSGSDVFNAKTEISKVLSNNRSKLLAYTALGESVPKNLWLTYFIVKDDGKMDIKGESANVEDIYAFYKNMKDSLINTQLRIHKLEMNSDNLDDVVASVKGLSDYSFELTNMSDADLLPPKEDSDENVKDGDKAESNDKAKNDDSSNKENKSDVKPESKSPATLQPIEDEALKQ